jgi:hypothetical protein
MHNLHFKIGICPLNENFSWGLGVIGDTAYNSVLVVSLEEKSRYFEIGIDFRYY